METKEPQQRRGYAGEASLVLSIISLLAFIVLVVLANSLNWPTREQVTLQESPVRPFVFIGVLALVGVSLGIKGLKKPHRPAIATIGLVLSMVVLGGVAIVGSMMAILYWFKELAY